MRERPYKKLLRLNQSEKDRLLYLSKSTGLNQEQVLRKALMNAPLLERPTADYLKMSYQISALGNNLNQLAHVANVSGNANNTDLLIARQIMEKKFGCISKEAVCHSLYQNHTCQASSAKVSGLHQQSK